MSSRKQSRTRRQSPTVILSCFPSLWPRVAKWNKLGNVWVFIPLIHRPKIICTKTQTLPNLFLFATVVYDVNVDDVCIVVGARGKMCLRVTGWRTLERGRRCGRGRECSDTDIGQSHREASEWWEANSYRPSWQWGNPGPGRVMDRQTAWSATRSYSSTSPLSFARA